MHAISARDRHDVTDGLCHPQTTALNREALHASRSHRSNPGSCRQAWATTHESNSITIPAHAHRCLSLQSQTASEGVSGGYTFVVAVSTCTCCIVQPQSSPEHHGSCQKRPVARFNIISCLAYGKSKLGRSIYIYIYIYISIMCVCIWFI